MNAAVQEAQAGVNALIARFSTPETSQMTFRVGAEQTEGLRMDINVRNHRITVDEPKALGGTDKGANPVELMLAALISCQAITYRVWAMKMGIAIDTVKVEADGHIDLRGFFGIDSSIRPGYSSIKLRVQLSGPESAARYQELADEVDRHCPVHDIAGKPVPIERVLH